MQKDVQGIISHSEGSPNLQHDRRSSEQVDTLEAGGSCPRLSYCPHLCVASRPVGQVEVLAWLPTQLLNEDVTTVEFESICH